MRALLLVLLLSGCASTAVNSNPDALKQVQLRKSEAGGWWAALSGQTLVCTLQTIGLSEAQVASLLPAYTAFCGKDT